VINNIPEVLDMTFYLIYDCSSASSCIHWWTVSRLLGYSCWDVFVDFCQGILESTTQTHYATLSSTKLCAFCNTQSHEKDKASKRVRNSEIRNLQQEFLTWDVSTIRGAGRISK